MNALTDDRLSKTFVALSDPTRRAILARLAKGDAVASELARPFRISAPAISRHLRVLADVGLVERRVRARWRVYGLRASGLRAASDWLESYRQFWENSIDRLVEYVQTPSQSNHLAAVTRGATGQRRRRANSSKRSK